MIANKEITYDQIRKTNHSKFHDLEMSMRLLYDHESDKKGYNFGDLDDFDSKLLGKRKRKNQRRNKRGPAVRPRATKY